MRKSGDFVAVKEIDLQVKDGAFTVLVGPSGCGKTTTLRMIAGLEEVTSGEVSIDDRVVNRVPPKDRDIAMVFQNYPHQHIQIDSTVKVSPNRNTLHPLDSDTEKTLL
jgi:multiple sugar transport system ATP-binding protein